MNTPPLPPNIAELQWELDSYKRAYFALQHASRRVLDELHQNTKAHNVMGTYYRIPTSPTNIVCNEEALRELGEILRLLNT